MANLRKHAVQETGTLELLDASDEPLLKDDGKPVTITVYGPGSKKFAEAQAMKNNKMMDRLRKKGKSDQTGAQVLAEKAEFLAIVTASSDGLELDDLTPDSVECQKAVYAAPELGFIPDQMDKYLGEWSNFLKSAPKA